MKWSDYQTAIFEAVEHTNDSLLIEAVAGCLTGDTIIGLNRAGRSFKIPLRDVVHRFNGGLAGSKLWHPDIFTYIRAPYTAYGTVRLTKLEAATESGMKSVGTLFLKSGKSVSATCCHRFLTSDGWKRLDELTAGTTVITEASSQGPGQGRTPKRNYLKRCVPFHPRAVNSGKGNLSVPTHRLNVEAHINDMDLEEFVWRLQSGAEGLKFLDDGLEVHHKDNKQHNNGFSNLEVMTAKEHRLVHATDNINNVQTHLIEDKVSHIIKAGEELTYDLTVPGVDAFIANGIVVHNSGKTSTIVEAIKHVPRSQSVIFVAFNKHIADELKRRISSPNAECKTLHSVGFKAWRDYLAKNGNSACKIENGKTRMIIKDYCSPLERMRYGEDLAKLVSLAKGSGIVPQGMDLKGLLEDNEKVWDELIYFFSLDPDGCNPDVTRKVLKYSIELSKDFIDFDDMLFLPVISDVRFDKYDVIFIDELQDVNAIQVEIVDRMRKPTSRVIGVGDRNQACYGFRGALSGSMDHVAKRFSCKQMPLTISYRCPKSGVKKAREFVKHIQHHEAAPEGIVTEYPETWFLKDFKSTDAILCRNSKPLIRTAFMLIRNKISCQVLGRDIGQGLIKLIKKMKSVSIPDLIAKLARYREKEIEKARARDDEARIQFLDDKLETINVFIDESEPETTVDMLVNEIDTLFSDTTDGRLTLSTIHKFKGLERDRVFVLDAHILMPSKYAKQKWQMEQENNLCYIAATRHKQELYYISGECLREGDPVKVEKPTVSVGRIEEDETVMAAIAEGRHADDIYLIDCPACGIPSYWNEGSHCTCRGCNQEIVQYSDGAYTLSDYWVIAEYPCDEKKTPNLEV